MVPAPDVSAPVYASRQEPAAALPPPCGSGVVFVIDLDTKTLIAVPTFCDRWDCERCARRKVRKIRAIAAAGKPERIITLTTRPQPWRSTRSAVRWFRKCQAKLFAAIKKEFHKTPYCSFLEFHKSGWPHLHILVRGSYIPQRWLSTQWLSITGSWKVYIQKVDNTWKAVGEATKYFLKTARDVRKTSPTTPVYTKSRDWLPPDWTDGDKPPGNYQFYAYARMPWAETLATLEELGATLIPSLANPAHVEVHMLGPPDPDVARGIEACGDFAELEILSCLQAIATAPNGLATDVNELKDMQHYYARPWNVE